MSFQNKKDSTDTIKVIQFCESSEIPEIYYESSYYLGCEKGNEVFSLLHNILTENKRVALAKVVLRAKDHFLAIKPYNGVFIAYDLHFPAEIRDTKEIEQPLTVGFDDETIQLAKGLISKMTKAFDPTQITDEYTAGLREIIKAKSESKVVALETKRESKKVVGLKDALSQSLAMAV